jgi:hypothetical protein
LLVRFIADKEGSAAPPHQRFPARRKLILCGFGEDFGQKVGSPLDFLNQLERRDLSHRWKLESQSQFLFLSVATLLTLATTFES